MRKTDTQPRFLRLKDVIGDQERGIDPRIPVSASTWWKGVKDGRFPKPIKLGEKTTVWRESDINDLICGK